MGSREAHAPALCLHLSSLLLCEEKALREEKIELPRIRAAKIRHPQEMGRTKKIEKLP